MFQKSHKFKNTATERRYIEAIFGFTYFIYFCQIKVSTKHYKISFGIKYFVHDLIRDVYYCA